MYPKFLHPTQKEIFIINDHQIVIPKCIVEFNKWDGQPLNETFGGKPVLSVDNKPMFAELAILNEFIKDGWEARWVETYGKKFPIHLTEWLDDKYKNQIHVPYSDKKVELLLAEIAI